MRFWQKFEQQAILAVLKGEELSAPYDEFIKSAAFSKHLKAHKIISLFRNKLLEDYQIQNPALEKVYFKQQALNHYLLTEAARFSDCLNNADYQFHPLKGVSFLWDLDFTLSRDIKDVDFLVRKSDLADIISLTKEQGYASENLPNALAGRLQLRIQHAIELTANSSGLGIDLHWKLAESFIANQGLTEEYWERQASHEMLLVNTIIQAYKNNWSVLQDYLDMKFLIEEKKLDLIKFKKITEEFFLTKMVSHTLSQYDLIFGASVCSKLFPNFNTVFNYDPHNSLYELRKYLAFNPTIFGKLKALLHRFVLPYERDLSSKDSSLFDIIRATLAKLTRKFSSK